MISEFFKRAEFCGFRSNFALNTNLKGGAAMAKKKQKRYQNIPMRKSMAIVCYMISMAALAVCGYVTWTAYKGDMARTLGFLIFLPIWIASYWFSTFFIQLAQVRIKGELQWLIGKVAGVLLNSLNNILSTGLMIFWIYIYVFAEVGGIEKFFM